MLSVENFKYIGQTIIYDLKSTMSFYFYWSRSNAVCYWLYANSNVEDDSGKWKAVDRMNLIEVYSIKELQFYWFAIFSDSSPSQLFF